MTEDTPRASRSAQVLTKQPGALWRGLRIPVLALILALVAAPFLAGLGRAESLVATWYGPGFEGATTASGEPFDATGYTAASRTLPFDTRLLVTYNGLSVVVRVNDRGPFTGEDIDLSQAAAEYIGLTSAGSDTVDVVTVDESTPTGPYTASADASPTAAQYEPVEDEPAEEPASTASITPTNEAPDQYESESAGETSTATVPVDEPSAAQYEPVTEVADSPPGGAREAAGEETAEEDASDETAVTNALQALTQVGGDQYATANGADEATTTDTPETTPAQRAPATTAAPAAPTTSAPTAAPTSPVASSPTPAADGESVVPSAPEIVVPDSTSQSFSATTGEPAPEEQSEAEVPGSPEGESEVVGGASAGTTAAEIAPSASRDVAGSGSDGLGAGGLTVLPDTGGAAL